MTNRRERGFTIVELLVVIVIIAVLSAISVVVYSGIRQRAAHAAVEAEASQLQTQLALYNAENGDYPSGSEFNPDSDPDCGNESSFCFDGQYPVIYDCDDFNSCSFDIWPDDGGDGECRTPSCGGGVGGEVGSGTTIDLTPPTDCPSGFIPVAGTAKYGQKGFCVMKYEAKNVGEKAISQPDGTPWGGVSQLQAIDYSTAACDGCHLINEAEWMTIAKNVAEVKTNWTGGSVGSGTIYNGLNQKWYGLFLTEGEASNDDNDGYYDLPTNKDNTERRTYKLSNNEIIWDLSGNYAEFTSGQISDGKPGCSPYDMCEYSMINNFGNMSINIFPGSMGIPQITSQNATQLGLGQIWSSPDDSTKKAIIRGHNPNLLGGRGLLEVNLFIASNEIPLTPDNTSRTGFRVAR